MKAEDVMRALECCVVNSNCNGCPFWEGYVTHRNCLETAIKNALALLREKDAEIEMLKAQKYMAYPDGRIEMIPTVESVRADTVRKMIDAARKQAFMAGDNQYISIAELEEIAKEIQ